MWDHVVAPKKDEVAVTVGGAGSDLAGFTSCAIQKAVDAVSLHGGGIVRLGEGTYDITAPVRLYDNITLTGAGEKTILRKCDGFETGFVVDADYGELKAVVSDSSGFKPGMGIQLYDSENSSGWAVSIAVITAVEGNTLYFDTHLIQDYCSDLGGTISNACSIIGGTGVRNVKISNLTVDGNKDKNARINGCRGGGIYLHKAKDCTVENVKVIDFNGDGISWQITEDIKVSNCEVAGTTNFGLHPGTGSLRSVVENCRLHHNSSDGFFVCWRVQHGVFRGNEIFDNGGSGINIGHKDTDNIFEGNRICNNMFSGIHLRKEKEDNGSHRNIYRGNTIENNGGSGKGCGIFINCPVEDNTIEENIIRDTGKGVQKTGIIVNEKAENLRICGNTMSGHCRGDISETSCC
jgi:parallel beta-helix repeat protein